MKWKKVEKKDIALKFGIPSNTLSTILKSKDKLVERSKNVDFSNKQKRIKTCVYADIDGAMIKWVTTARDKNLPISGTLIREKAREFADALGHEDFSASIGWLDKFKKRHNIVQKAICGESAAVNLELSENWQIHVLPNLISQYNANDIFNADETGVFFKCLPNKTLAFKNENCFGGKNSKERITVMVCSNMSGSEKIKLLVIGKSKNPRCFKNVKSLEVDYDYNRKAWMTSVIFEKWLLRLEKRFASQNRNVLLFIDNCPAHPKHLEVRLSHIKIAYFPPNMTSVLQPMDQGIIKNLKQHYRKRILMKVLANMDRDIPTTVTILDAIRDLSKTWNVDVKQQTISNCFRKAGFVNNGSVQDIDWDADDLVPLAELKVLWASFTSAINMDSVSFEDYVNVDEDVPITDFPTDDDILESVIESQITNEKGLYF